MFTTQEASLNKVWPRLVKLHNTQRNRSRRLACTLELTRSLTVCPLAILASMRFVCLTYHCFSLEFFPHNEWEKSSRVHFKKNVHGLKGGWGGRGGESVCPTDWTHHSYNYPPFGLSQFPPLVNTIHTEYHTVNPCQSHIFHTKNVHGKCPFKWS